MNPGDTILFRDPGRSERLWVVVAVRGDRAAIVGLGPAEANSDEGDIIGPADHPDLDEDCTARYRLARFVPVAALRNARQRGLAETGSPCSPGLLRRIQHGALASPFTEQGIHEAIRRRLEPPSPR